MKGVTIKRLGWATLIKLLLLWSKNFATTVIWRHTSLYYGGQSEPRENTRTSDFFFARPSSRTPRASFACGSRVNSRDFPKWRDCSQAWLTPAFGLICWCNFVFIKQLKKKKFIIYVLYIKNKLKGEGSCLLISWGEADFFLKKEFSHHHAVIVHKINSWRHNSCRFK